MSSDYVLRVAEPGFCVETYTMNIEVTEPEAVLLRDALILKYNVSVSDIQTVSRIADRYGTGMNERHIVADVRMETARIQQLLKRVFKWEPPPEHW